MSSSCFLSFFLSHTFINSGARRSAPPIAPPISVSHMVSSLDDFPYSCSGRKRVDIRVLKRILLFNVAKERLLLPIEVRLRGILDKENFAVLSKLSLHFKRSGVCFAGLESLKLERRHSNRGFTIKERRSAQCFTNTCIAVIVGQRLSPRDVNRSWKIGRASC